MYNVLRDYAYDEKKNRELIDEGRPSFQEAIAAITAKKVLMDVENTRHPGQHFFVVVINDYPHAVPYEMRDGIHWLITVFPARKYKPYMSRASD